MDDYLSEDIARLKAKIKVLEDKVQSLDSKIKRLEANQGRYITGDAWRQGQMEYAYEQLPIVIAIVIGFFIVFIIAIAAS